jgi:hypothetical protein
MKASILLLIILFLVSCNSETVKDKTKVTSKKQLMASIHQTIVSIKQRIKGTLKYHEKEEEIYFDTIPVIDKVHFVCLEFHDIDELVFSLIRKGKNKTTCLIPKTKKTGGFYDTVLVKDYNFDKIKDIDVVIRPGCRTGANTFHNIYLRKGSKFVTANIPPYSYLSPVFKEKTIYGIYNGPDDREFIKAKWKKDSLLITELVEIKNSPNNESYKAVYYQYKGNKKKKIKEEIIQGFPESYTKIVSKHVLY